MSSRKKIVSSRKELREVLRESGEAKGLIFPWFSGIIERLVSLSQEMSDNSTAVKQTAEEKEKLPKREVVKPSRENFVNQSLDKQEVNSNLEVQQKNLSAEVLSVKKDEKSKEAPVKGAETIDNASKVLGFSKEERATLGKYNAEWNDEKTLEKRLNNLEGLQKDLPKIKGLLGKKESEGVSELELFDKLLNKYTVRDEGGSRFYTFEEVIGEPESKNPLKKLWMIIRHPFEYFKYMQIKNIIIPLK